MSKFSRHSTVIHRRQQARILGLCQRELELARRQLCRVRMGLVLNAGRREVGQ